MSDTALPVIKEDGSKQRVDVALTALIAHALVNRIMEGLSVYPEEKDGFYELAIGTDTLTGELILEKIHYGTIQSWVQREIVIPEDGRKLRDVLDEARIEKKRMVRELRQDNIIETSEKALEELVKIPIIAGKTIETRFRKNKRGFVAYGKVETEFEGVNPKLAEAKIKALTFGLERLDSHRYGSKSETKNTHLVFSLADLRRAKERRDELISEST